MNDFAGYGYCGECGKAEAEIYAQVISWDYAGTHCTHGRPGVHYEGTDFLSRCCDAPAYTNEELTIEFDNSNVWEDEPEFDTYEELYGLR